MLSGAAASAGAVAIGLQGFVLAVAIALVVVARSAAAKGWIG
ncbi:MAG: hypothetical protein ACYC7F_04165 [Gemmatimonadaceae bacterium]